MALDRAGNTVLVGNDYVLVGEVLEVLADGRVALDIKRVRWTDSAGTGQPTLTPDSVDILPVPTGGGGAPDPHAATHQHAGGDEVATATPAANAIPKADGSNKLAVGWLNTGVANATDILTRADGDGRYDSAGGLAAHVAAADPHTGYQLESEKGVASGYGSLDVSALQPAAQSPALTGNVTKPAGSLITTIPAGTITPAMHQNILSDTLMGRDAPGSGVPTAISLAAGGGLGFTGSDSFGISANGVTLAMLAQIATTSILGRITAATGNVEVLTAAQARTVLALGTAALLNEGLGGSDLVNATNMANYIAAVLIAYEVLAAKGAANGYAPLNASAVVPPANLPAALTEGADTLTAATDAGNEGYIPIRHFIRADATRTFTSNTSPQAIFTSPANGRITLETGLYRVEGVLYFTAMSATSGNRNIDLLGAGTATIGAWLWMGRGQDSAAGTVLAGGGTTMITSTSGASIVVATTATAMGVQILGTFEVTGAGTMIPTTTMVTAAASVLAIGSYLSFERMGATTAVSLGQWD